MTTADSPLMACILCRNLPCAGPCRCPVDGVDITHHVAIGYCPHPDGPREPYAAAAKPDGWDAVPKAEEMAKERAEQMARDAAERARVGTEVAGRAAWMKLHTEGPGRDAAWLVDWEKLIPCGECKAKYAALKEKSPPTFPLTFKWTWETHDAVNVDLKKERMGLEAARDRWLVKPGAMQRPEPGGEEHHAEDDRDEAGGTPEP